MASGDGTCKGDGCWLAWGETEQGCRMEDTEFVQRLGKEQGRSEMNMRVTSSLLLRILKVQEMEMGRSQSCSSDLTKGKPEVSKRQQG